MKIRKDTNVITRVVLCNIVWGCGGVVKTYCANNAIYFYYITPKAQAPPATI